MAQDQNSQGASTTSYATVNTGVSIDYFVGEAPHTVTIGQLTLQQDTPPVVRFALSAADHGGILIYTLQVELSEVATAGVIVPLQFTGSLVRGTDWNLVNDSGATITTSYLVFAVGETTKTLNFQLTTLDAGTIVASLVTANSSSTLTNATIGTPSTFTMNANPSANIETAFTDATSDVAQGAETHTVEVTLSEPAIVQQSCRVKIITTTHPTVSLLSEVLTFEVGEDTKYATLNWEAETIPGDRSVQLEITIVTQGQIGAQDTHQVTIEGQTILTADITVPVSGPTIDEGETKDLVLTLAAPAAQNFNIPVTRTGTATASQYAIDWPNPSLVDVLPVTAGDDEIRIPITRNVDADATGTTTLTFNFGAAPNQEYTLSATSVDVSLLDDDANNPFISFEYQNYVTRQGEAKQIKVIASPAPTAPLTVYVTEGGNATAGEAPVTWPGGVAGEVAIGTGVSEVLITVSPPDGAQTVNVERDFTITADAAYNLGTFAYASMIIEPELDASYDGDSEVLYDQIPGVPNTLVRLALPIDPVDAGSLPALEIEGVKAAVHPHTYDWAGRVDNVLVHCLVPHRPGDPAVDAKATLKPTALADPGANQFYDLDLSALTLEMEIRQYGRVRAFPFALETKSRESWWCSEKMYWALFEFLDDSSTIPGMARPCGVKTMVRRRSDVDVIELEFRFCFDLFNLTDPEGFMDFRSSSNGTVYAKHIRITSSTVPSGHVVGDAFEDVAQSGVNLVAPGAGANDWHRFDSGTSLIRSCYIRNTSTTTQAQAEAAQRLHGFGYAHNGEYSVHARPTFGSEGRYVARYGSAYNFNGQEGRAGLRAMFADKAAAEIQIARNGTIGHGFHSVAHGYWHPYSEPSLENGGSNDIVFTTGQYYMREEVVHRMIMARYSLYRNACGLTNYYTGEEISAQDLANANGGEMPWGLYSEDNFYHLHVPQMYNETDFVAGGANTPRVHKYQGQAGIGRGRAPQDRPWNQPDGGSPNIIQPDYTCPYVAAEGQWGWAGIDHLIRDTHTYESPALHGELMYMDLMERRAQWVMRCSTRFEVSGTGIDNVFVWKGECIPEAVRVLNKPGARKFAVGGGYENAGNPQVPFPADASLQGLGRGIGHQMHTVATAGRFMAPGTGRKLDAQAWARAFVDLQDIRLGPYGHGDRVCHTSATHPAGIQAFPDDECTFGITDLGNETGAIPEGSGAGFCLDQTFMAAYFSHGFADLEYAFRPRHVRGEYDSGYKVAYERSVLGLLQNLFTYAYSKGEKMAPGWTISHSNGDGFPDGAIGSGAWEITNARPFKGWTFRFSTPSEQATLGCSPQSTNYQLYAGQTGQMGPWIAGALSFSRVNGRTGINFSDYIRTTEEGLCEGEGGTGAVVFSNMFEVSNSILERISRVQQDLPPGKKWQDSRWPYILGEVQALLPVAVAPPTPVIDEVNPGDSSIEVVWSPGVGAGVNDTYVIQWRTDAGTYNTINRHVTGTGVVSYNITGLTNTELYWVRVSAREPQEGLETAAAEQSATPVAGGGNADAPQNVVWTPGSGQASATWDFIPSGAMIIYQSATSGDYDPPAAEHWFPNTSSSGTVFSLTDGVTYYFVILARDGIGTDGPFSEEWFVIPGAGGSAGPTTAPGAPTNVTAVPQDGSILVTWDPPA